MSRLPQRIVDPRIGPSGAAGLSFKDQYSTFSVEMGNGRSPNKCKLEIWNLSKASITFITKPRNTLQLLVGEDVPSLLYIGEVAARSVQTRKEGKDRITTIECADGRRIYRDAGFFRAYPPNTARDLIVGDILAAMATTVGHRPPLPPRNYSNGWGWAGKARDALTMALRPDATWSIQNGAVQIEITGQPLPGNTVLISKLTGMRGTPVQTKKGISFKVKLNTALRIGGPIRTQSELVSVSGDWRVVKLLHDGNQRGTVWDSSGEALPLP